MTFSEYQKLANKTIQSYKSDDQENFFLGYLGLAGEAGSVLTLMKKLIRDGEGFGTFEKKLKEELGDVLWYITAIASHYNIKLEEIADENLTKINDRYQEIDLHKIPRFDEKYEEQFPDTFIINFIEEEGEHFLTVKMVWEKESAQVPIGDPLTDNSRLPNEYRFHDVFHLGYIAYLGWSPVLRQLMKLKRKSDPIVLDAEDRGRPQVAEEAITLIIYNYAKSNKMFKQSERIDTDLLHMIKQIVLDLEVSTVTAFQWEKAIIESYGVFHEVVKNKGGRVLVSPKERVLKYLGKE